MVIIEKHRFFPLMLKISIVKKLKMSYQGRAGWVMRMGMYREREGPLMRNQNPPSDRF